MFFEMQSGRMENMMKLSRQIVKRIVDFAMIVFLPLLMAEILIGQEMHEWLGMGMLVLFIIHHILNAGWWKSLFKGKYTPSRALSVTLGLLLLLDMAALGISGIMMSDFIFGFLPISGGMMIARQLHLLASYWGLILMSAHLGMHMDLLMGVGRKLFHVSEKNAARAWILRAATAGISAYGIYAVFSQQLGEYLFLQTHFVRFDETKAAAVYFVETAAAAVCRMIWQRGWKRIIFSKYKGGEGMEVLQREFIYVWYYFCVQFQQIFRYWILGMAIGSVISVFAKDKIHKLFEGMRERKLGLFGIIPACILGILSPLCMYGTIPIAASFSEKGMRDDWLAAFMMASILLNPQLMIYSAALGGTALAIRLFSCFLCGAAAGVLVFFCFRGKPFFNFCGFASPHNHDTDPNVFFRLLKNFGRNVKATGPMFLAGILLSALFQRYVPADTFAELFGKGNEGFGVLMAATVGVPLYACGGGTIPLLQQWLLDGMSMGSAAAFMITGPATKITNLGAVKIVLGVKHFIFYMAFVMLFSLCSGWLVNLII